LSEESVSEGCITKIVVEDDGTQSIFEFGPDTSRRLADMLRSGIDSHENYQCLNNEHRKARAVADTIEEAAGPEVMTDGGFGFEQGERIAEALEDIAEELEYQNAVLAEQARAQHLTAVASSDYADPDEKPTSTPNTRSLLSMIEDQQHERERAEDSLGGGL
jgi:hypothetical protein